MDINIYDKTNSLIDCRCQDNFVFSQQFQDTGSFEIVSNLTAEVMETYKPNYIVQIGNNQQAGIIESISITYSDGIPSVSVKGRLLLSILERRIFKTAYTTTGTPSSIIENLILYIESIENRALGFSFISDIEEEESEYDFAFNKGSSYAEALLDIAQVAGYGLKVIYRPELEHPFEIHLHNGKDRSLNQTEIDPIILSSEYMNISNTEYELNLDGFANVVYVSGYDNLKEISIDEPSGLDRREIYIEDSTEVTGTLTEDEIERRLNYTGIKELASHSLTEAISGDSLEIKEEYAIGDVVSVQEKSLGVYTNLRIMEITESQTELGYEITPTLAS